MLQILQQVCAGAAKHKNTSFTHIDIYVFYHYALSWEKGKGRINMKKTVVIIISLVLCAGLFCFLFFGGEKEKDKGGELRNTIEDIVSQQRKTAGENENANEKNYLNENEASKTDSHKQQNETTGEKNNSEKDSDKEHSSLNHSSHNKTDENSHNNNADVNSQKTEIIKVNQDLPENTKGYNADLKSLAGSVLDTFQIDENGFSFMHPFVPDGLHLGVKLQVFKSTSLGDEAIIRYVSDSGWLNDETYDSGKHSVNAAFKDYYIGSEAGCERLELNDVTTVLEIKSYDLESGVVQIYDAYIKNGEVMLLTAENKEGF